MPTLQAMHVTATAISTKRTELCIFPRFRNRKWVLISYATYRGNQPRQKVEAELEVLFLQFTRQMR